MSSIRSYLEGRRVPFEALLHGPAASSARRAHSVHVPGRAVAKAVLVATDRGHVLAVLPATHRIDFDRLAACLGVEKAGLAPEEEVVRVFADCERGALPPFGRLYGLATIVDTSLAGAATIVVEGNSRHEDLRLRYRDYEALEAPMRGRFSAPTCPRRTAPQRRAG